MDSEPLRLVVDAQQPAQATTTIDGLIAACSRAVPAAKSLGDAGKVAAAGLSAIPAGLQQIDARTDALRASVDPLALAMKRANAEMAEAKGLYAAGAIGAQEYTRYVGILEARLESATTAQNALNLAHARGAAATRVTGAEMLNLSRQAADVGVSLAMGMSPLMVLIAQGPQIGETLALTSSRGIGLTAVLRQMAVAGWAALGPLAPIIAALTAVGAVGAGSLALLTMSFNEGAESADELQKRLGFTDDQMKRLKKSGESLHVTMGDSFKGIMKVAGEEFARLGEWVWGFIGGPLTEFGRAVADVWDQGVAAVVQFVRATVGSIGGAVGGIRAVWSSLPAAIGDVVISTANAVIRGTATMVNRTIDVINGLIDKANAAAQSVGLSVQLPRFGQVEIAEIANAYSGLGRVAMESFAAGAEEGQAQALAGLDGVVAYARDIAARSRDAARGYRDARLTEAAGDPKKERQGRDKKELDEFSASLRDFLALAAERNRLAEQYQRIFERTPTDKDMAKAEYAQIIRQQAAAYADAADIMADADARAQDAAQGMAASFGKVGKALGDVLTSMTRYGAKSAELAARRKAEGVTAEEIARIDRESAQARVSYYGDMLGAAKGFFREGSDGYKAMQAVEAGYRAWQFAASIQSAVQAQVEAATKTQAASTAVAAHTGAAATIMATDAATTSTGIAAGAARIFAELGPWAFPVVAAMMGVMASLGAGGGGVAAGVLITERRQREQGTGSVLGDAAAKSESIARALDIVATAANRDLEYSNGMLQALRSIDSQIGTVAAALARSFGSGGMLDTSALNLGTTTKGPGLGQSLLFGGISQLLPGLFGSTTTRKLLDQGVQFDAASLESILGSGLTGEAYQQILSTTKKKAFGITYSESSKKKTTTTDLDADFLRQTQLLIGSLRDGVVAAASVLGVEGAAATLAAFQVSLGKISLKDLSGAEIEEALSAVFSKLGDQMAGAVLPGLTALQKVGEGLFETLVRTARTYQVVDTSLASIGKSFGLVGVASLEARQRLVDLFGGMEEFADATSTYADLFLTEAERLAPIQTAVTAELARLGLQGVKTRDQFKAVIAGLDVSTAAGAELYAALMNLAPAFAKLTEESEAVRTAKDNLSSAYARERDTLGETVDRYRELASSLGDFRASLYSGPAAGLSPEAAYRAAQAEFARVAGLAAGGDADALGRLQSVSEAYLQASRDFNASSAGYFADLDAVREAVTAAEGIAGAQADIAVQQLTELQNLVSGYIEVNESVLSVRDAITALQVAQGAPPEPVASLGSTASANDNSALVARLEALEARLLEVTAQLAAANEQRAAIYYAEKADLEEQTDALGRRLRDISA